MQSDVSLRKRLGKGSRHAGQHVIPIIALRRDGPTIATRTTEPPGPQVQIDPTIKDREMTQIEPHAVGIELGRLPPALMTDRVVVGSFNLNRHLAFTDLHIQDSNVGKIQQSLDQV